MYHLGVIIDLWWCNPLKSLGCIIYPHEVVSRYHDPQDQVCEQCLHNVQFEKKCHYTLFNAFF